MLPGVGNMHISFPRDPAEERLHFLSLPRRVDRQRVPAFGSLLSIHADTECPIQAGASELLHFVTT